MFTIEMLPAAEGDCLWIEFGDPGQPHRILIDTGTPGTYKALARRIHDLPAGRRFIDLFVVTHIDGDHVGAASHLLNRRPFGVEFGDVWFNGRRHLPQKVEVLGARQGETFSRALDSQQVPWNQAFGGAPVMVGDDGALPTRTVGGMRLTVLSPYRRQLAALAPVWDAELRRLAQKAAAPEDRLLSAPPGPRAIDVAWLAESPFKEDDKEANGSSIALLAEFDGRRVLLGADAFPSVIETSVRALLAGSGQARLALDAFKVCHHGSKNNTSPGLAGRLAAGALLVSSSGQRHDHPDLESIARLLHFGSGGEVELHFNYRSPFNSPWADAGLARRHRYVPHYPAAGSAGVRWSAPD